MEQTALRVSSPADLVLALPHLVGFPPEESIVVGCLQGPRKRLGLLMRLDLPDRADEAELAAELAARVRHEEAAAAFVVCLTEAEPTGVTEAEPSGVTEAEPSGVTEAEPTGVTEADPTGPQWQR